MGLSLDLGFGSGGRVLFNIEFCWGWGWFYFDFLKLPEVGD